ncbi:methyltransferase-like protein 4-like [Planoprotostelium fungivorum]|uniref:Methyltransferase-like protein 4-like n=1 Tax=Planoprotostelium fungivorum TaxID=1890364 RepID=A0A2P6N619_9EUKA|nr:methyltransferase-like protein 4-like [Planoprotostelium fungivorum]
MTKIITIPSGYLYLEDQDEIDWKPLTDDVSSHKEKVEEPEIAGEGVEPPRKKRRGNLDSTEEAHQLLCLLIIRAMREAKEAYESQTRADVKAVLDNVRAQSSTAEIDLAGCVDTYGKFQSKFEDQHGTDVLFIDQPQEEIPLDIEYFNRVVCNRGPERQISLLEARLCLSSKSHFSSFADFRYLQTSDIKDIRRLSRAPHHGQYNIVVMDPPWENKSVDRSKKYKTLPNYSLFSIPVVDLLYGGEATENPCGLFAVWVTNKLKFQRFVTETLFPKWRIEYLTTWYWIKIDREGQLIFPLSSSHRRPYEPLLIGRFSRRIDEELENFPREPRFLISRPGAHSTKPKLNSIFSPFLEGDVRGLELFARNLIGGWTSWGNEVLQNQMIKETLKEGAFWLLSLYQSRNIR